MWTSIYLAQICNPLQTKAAMMPSFTSLHHWVSLELFIGIWEGVTYVSRKDSKTAVSPRPIPVWVTSHRRWKPGPHCTIFWQLSGLESILFMLLSWDSSRKLDCSFSSSGRLTDLCFFQVVGLLSQSLHLDLSENNQFLLLLFSQRGISPVRVILVSFGNFLNYFWVIYFLF